MNTRPLPFYLERIPISYEVDFAFEIAKIKLSRNTPEELQHFIQSRGYDERVIQSPFSGPEGCYLPYRPSEDKPPLRERIDKIRAEISKHIGLEPAAFHVFIEGYYDSEFLKTYRYSFSTRCKYGRLDCIRPSHLIPTDYLGRPLRP